MMRNRYLGKKQFIDLHRGVIWAESEGVGKGSTIRFVIPTHDPDR
jgi:signal transduction histidine kinase